MVPMEQRYPPVFPTGWGGGGEEVTGGGGREGKKKGGEGHQRNGPETKYIFKGQVNTHIYACTHMCGISYIIWLLYIPFVIIYIMHLYTQSEYGVDKEKRGRRESL